MVRLFLPCLGKYKKYALLGPLAVMLEVVFEVLIPRVMASIIDNGVLKGDTAYILRTGMLMILMAVASLVFGALSARFSSVAATGFSMGVRKELFDKIQDFSFANIDRFGTPSLITRTTTDVDNLQRAVMMMLRMAVRAPLMLVFSLGMAVSLNARLALIFLVVIPFLGGILAYIIKTAFPLFQILLKKYDWLNAMVQENLVAIRVVKSFVRESHESERFAQVAGELRDIQRKAEKTVILNMPVMQFVMYGCMIAVAWFGGGMIISGDMTTGQLMGFLSYITQILISLMMLSMIFVTVVLSKASLARITEVLTETPDITDESADEAAVLQHAGIEFDRISFSYGKGTPVLRNVSLRIEPGQTVGIIGGTGSAKTTLVQLILRLYDVQEGRVLVGGRNVKEYPLAALRKAALIVLQNNLLFSGTIRENLLWGDHSATDEQLIHACTIAQAHDFILSFPDGYDTMLGQGGINLSGGQRQRLCIARALVARPRILILDDSTSALDTHTDSLLRAGLKEELKGSTLLIIAQRLESVRDADFIVVMDDGAVSAVGTHDTLLEKSPIYREVYLSQQKGVLDNG